MTTLVLASVSPQRFALLKGLGVLFEVCPPASDEASCVEREPRERARVLAMMKAQDVATRKPGRFVVGCDTLVVSADGELFEKPSSADDARRMLTAQSGRTSQVHSGLCLLTPAGMRHEGISSSAVTFGPLTEQDIDRWISSKHWQGRSGGFQIDGPGQLLIERIEGDWTSIVGFPVYLFGELCRESGAPFLR